MTSAPAACADAAIAKAMLLGVSTPVTRIRLPLRRPGAGVVGIWVLTGDVRYKAWLGLRSYAATISGIAARHA